MADFLFKVLTNLLFLAVSVPALSAAQGRSLNLNEALQIGLKNSPKVQKAEAASGEAHWKKVETYNGWLPSVSVSATHLLGKQYQFVDTALNGTVLALPQIIPSNMWSINASLPLFEGFSSYNRTSAASLSEDAAINEAEWIRFQTEHEIRLKYYQAIAAQKLKSVSEQNLTTLMDHMNQARALKRGGAATAYDVLRVEVQMNEAQSEVIKSDDDVYLSRQRLAQTIGTDQEYTAIEGDLPVPNPAVVQKSHRQDMEQRKDLVALEQRAESMGKLETAAKSFWVPRIYLNGSWISYNNKNDSMEDHDAYRWAYNIGLTLNWTLFDVGTIARSQQAVYQRLQTKKTLTQTKLQGGTDFEFWRRRCLYSATLYKAKLSDVEKAQESVRLAKEAYRAGARTSSDVLDSELELFRSRAGVVNAQINYAEALLNLELSVGHNL